MLSTLRQPYMETKRIISIETAGSNTVLASAIENERVQLFEGAWYFDPQAVDMTHLVVSERTYNCPYKGVCYWIDLVGPAQQGQNVAFTYFDVTPGYEFIQDKIGFFAGRRQHTLQLANAINKAELDNYSG